MRRLRIFVRNGVVAERLPTDVTIVRWTKLFIVIGDEKIMRCSTNRDQIGRPADLELNAFRRLMLGDGAPLRIISMNAHLANLIAYRSLIHFSICLISCTKSSSKRPGRQVANRPSEKTLC